MDFIRLFLKEVKDGLELMQNKESKILNINFSSFVYYPLLNNIYSLKKLFKIKGTRPLSMALKNSKWQIFETML